MKRREFITLLGGAAALPFAARAQQPTVRVIGLLSGSSFADRTGLLAALRESLNELYYVEGKNVAFEYRSAEGPYGRLPAQAAELVRHPVSVIVTSDPPASALAAKAATGSIPIVFVGRERRRRPSSHLRSIEARSKKRETELSPSETGTGVPFPSPVSGDVPARREIFRCTRAILLSAEEKGRSRLAEHQNKKIG